MSVTLACDKGDTAYRGDTLVFTCTTTEPYYKVYWCVKPPWDTTEYGITYETDENTDDSLSTTFNYTLGDTAPTGQWVFTAYVYTLPHGDFIKSHYITIY